MNPASWITSAIFGCAACLALTACGEDMDTASQEKLEFLQADLGQPVSSYPSLVRVDWPDSVRAFIGAGGGQSERLFLARANNSISGGAAPFDILVSEEGGVIVRLQWSDGTREFDFHVKRLTDRFGPPTRVEPDRRLWERAGRRLVAVRRGASTDVILTELDP